MNRIAKSAKKVADLLVEYIDEFGEGHDKEELAPLMQAHGVLTEVVAHNGGPAWNATDGQWER